eukprot:scaffold34648_cov96-Isochrysis_galbana.AAC.1
MRKHQQEKRVLKWLGEDEPVYTCSATWPSSTRLGVLLAEARAGRLPVLAGLQSDVERAMAAAAQAAAG